MKSFLQWLDEDGFLVKQTWDHERNEWSDGPGLLKLFPFQRDILGHVFTPDENGKFPYSTIVYSTLKKSGKTIMLAAVLEWMAECAPPNSEIYSCANDMEQAQSRAFADVQFHVEKKLGLTTTAKRAKYDNGSFIQVLANQYSSAAGSRQILSTFDELWGYACTDPSTKILTRCGWKTVDELILGEDVATIGKDRRFEWQSLGAINRFPYSGQMVKLTHRRADMFMTPNHRVLGKFRRTGPEKLHEQPWEFRQAKDAMLAYEGVVPNTSDWVGEAAQTVTIPACYTRKKGGYSNAYNHWEPLVLDAKRWMEFFGYYISEGSILYTQAGGPPCAVGLAQDREKNFDIYCQMVNCVQSLGLDWSENEHGIRVRNPQLATYLNQFGKSTDKYVPVEYKSLSRELLTTFLDAYILGDGWQAGNGYQCETVSRQLVDDLLEIGLKCGYAVRLMSSRKRGENKNVIHRLSFSLGNTTYDKRNWSLVDYEGEVWCPTTANGTWLAQRNGTIYWTGNSESSRRMWAEMTPPATVKNAFRMVATYAGYENESDQLLDLYNLCFLKEGGKFINGEVVPELAHITDVRGEPVCRRNGKVFVYWDTEPRLPWQTAEFYEQELLTLRPSDFLRMHKNRWVTSNETFIPIELWDRATTILPGPLTLHKGDPRRAMPISIGIDIGTKYDTSAMVGVYYDSARRKAGVAFHRIWKPAQNGEILDLEMTVETELLKLWQEFKIVGILYDPTQFQRSAVALKKKGLPLIEVPQQGSAMIEMTQNFYDLLRSRNLEAYPDPELRDHIRYATAEHTPRGYRLKKEKHAKYAIDAAQALAMAAYDAVNRGGVDTSVPIYIASPFSDTGSQRIPTVYDELQMKLPEALRS